MLGNSAVVEELAASMVTVYLQGEDSLGTRLHPLDPIGELLIDLNRRNRTTTDIDFIGDPSKNLERIISCGDDTFLEYVIRTRNTPGLLVQYDGKSALHLIAECGLTSMMRRILPFIENVQDISPPLLHAAVNRPTWNVEMLNILVQHGVDVNAQYTNPSPIHVIAPSRIPSLSSRCAAVHILSSGKHWWYSKALQVLLNAGADPEALNDKGETALQLALAARHPDALENGIWCDQTLDVLLENGANVNIVASETDLTPLNTALESHCGPEIVQKLLSHGADTTFGPKPAIASAIESSDLISLEMLLEAGTDPNQVYRSDKVKRYEDDPQLETPLQTATCGQSMHGYDPWEDLERTAIVSLLVQYGANVSQKLKDGTTTVLHEVASLNGFVTPMLVDGINLEERDADGRTPLIRACNAPEIYKRAIEPEFAALELIEAGADVNAIDETGSTALHYALKFGEYPETIKKLLDKGASPNIKDGAGMAPLYHSFDSWRPQDTVDLMDAGADPLQRAPDGRTSLHYLAPKLMEHGAIPLGDERWRRSRSSDEPDYIAEYTNLYARCIEAGCDREARDENGNTPLFPFLSRVRPYYRMELEDTPDPEVIRKMFDEHDVHVVNDAGDSLLHVVAGRWEEHGHQEDGLMLFEMLVERGLDPKRENKRGATPVDVAAASGNEKILGLFARDE